MADRFFSDAMFGSGTLSKENHKEPFKGRLSFSSVLHFLTYIDCNGTQTVWRIWDVYPGYGFLSIPDPTTAPREGGFFVLPFFL